MFAAAATCSAERPSQPCPERKSPSLRIHQRASVGPQPIFHPGLHDLQDMNQVSPTAPEFSSPLATTHMPPRPPGSPRGYHVAAPPQPECLNPESHQRHPTQHPTQSAQPRAKLVPPIIRIRAEYKLVPPVNPNWCHPSDKPNCGHPADESEKRSRGRNGGTRQLTSGERQAGATRQSNAGGLDEKVPPMIPTSSDFHEKPQAVETANRCHPSVVFRRRSVESVPPINSSRAQDELVPPVS
jgi:hypothetical protein